jgi:hypothetical protein
VSNLCKSTNVICSHLGVFAHACTRIKSRLRSCCTGRCKTLPAQLFFGFFGPHGYRRRRSTSQSSQGMFPSKSSSIRGYSRRDQADLFSPGRRGCLTCISASHSPASSGFHVLGDCSGCLGGGRGSWSLACNSCAIGNGLSFGGGSSGRDSCAIGGASGGCSGCGSCTAGGSGCGSWSHACSFGGGSTGCGSCTAAGGVSGGGFFSGVSTSRGAGEAAVGSHRLRPISLSNHDSKCRTSSSIAALSFRLCKTKAMTSRICGVSGR